MDGGNSDPTELFDPVSNSTRVEILRTLATAHSEAPEDPWLEYSELRESADVRDNGNFNYHLDRLDHLVEKGSAGYRISRIGLQVVSAVASGAFDSEWTWGPVDAPGDCPFCDDPVWLRYEDGTLWLRCGTDEHAMGLSVSPRLLDAHPEEEVVELIAFLGSQWGGLLRRGICSECRGYVDGRIEFGGRQVEHYHYHGHCHHCGFQHGVPVGVYLLGHPSVIGFYDDHGVDVRSRPFWTLEWCSPGTETVLSTDPLRLRVDATHGGETLSITLDRDGSVVPADRS